MEFYYAWERFSKPIFQVVVSFDEVGVDQTKIVFKQIFNTAEECRKVKAFAGEKNEENLNRLEEELRNMRSNI